jgi:hypothetical protein
MHPATSRALAVLLTIASISPTAFARKDAPSAPVPSQIAAAKKLFIANGGVDVRFQQLGMTRAYDQFYAAMKECGHYELVSLPSDSELVFEISLVTSFDQYGDKYQPVPQLHLRILDAKSNVLLWALAEPLEAGKFYIVGGHPNEKFDKAMDRLVKDVKNLVNPAPAQSTGP